MTLLTLSQFSVTRGQDNVVRDVDMTINAGELVGLIGPNGAGKTSLMRGALGLIPCIGDSNLNAMTPSARAKRVAWMPQSREIHWPISVEDIVTLGRLPHFQFGQKMTPDDRAIIDAAIARIDIDHLRNRAGNALSGGEQARVLIARIVAQETPLILADEPIAGLDPKHQIATMLLFRELVNDDKAVLVSLHDLGLAARYCTRLIMVDQGGVVADGEPIDVLTPSRVADVFGVNATIKSGPDGIGFNATGLA